MNVVYIIAAWVILSIPVSLLVGRMIHFGTGESDDASPSVN